MNTLNSECNNNLKSAEGYFNAMVVKDFDRLASYLDDNVHYIDANLELHGKDPVVLASKGFCEIVQGVQIRTMLASDNRVMLVCDVVTLIPTIGKIRSAAFMEFTNKLISKLELFYDATPFAAKQN